MNVTTATAVYYPSRMSMHDIKILGKDVKATNNFGAACHENRNFINKDTLLQLDGGLNLYNQRVQPVPYCIILTGNMPNQQVLGMIGEPIRATWKDNTTGEKLIFMLENMLIIDQLPVPLHINIEADKLTSDKIASNLFGNFVNFRNSKFDVKSLGISYSSLLVAG